MTIAEFKGPYRWLSNFWLTPVTHNGYSYASAEHAYQAAKATCYNDTLLIQRARTPGDAKRLGKHIRLRSGWEENKVNVMLEILRAKFQENADLRARLLATGTEELIEGNTWHDTYWGVCNGKGKNMLGKLLMHVRAGLRAP